MRRARIVSSLRTKGAASVRELAETLQVSESTIRRDLDVLDRNGELVRTYGGAALSPQAAVPEISFAASAELDSAGKLAVAERAAALVEDDMVVVLDIGTSTRLIARRLRGRPVTVITANLAVFDELRDDEAVRLCLLGGVVRRNYLSPSARSPRPRSARSAPTWCSSAARGCGPTAMSWTTWRSRR
jgi:DeoR/GlpR family transcriptional regulator of sugar metabolism